MPLFFFKISPFDVASFYVGRWIDKQVLRYNHRKETDAERFVKAVSQIFGRRLTYVKLTGKNRNHTEQSLRDFNPE